MFSYQNKRQVSRQTENVPEETQYIVSNRLLSFKTIKSLLFLALLFIFVTNLTTVNAVTPEEVFLQQQIANRLPPGVDALLEAFIDDRFNPIRQQMEYDIPDASRTMMLIHAFWYISAFVRLKNIFTFMFALTQFHFNVYAFIISFLNPISFIAPYVMILGAILHDRTLLNNIYLRVSQPRYWFATTFYVDMKEVCWRCFTPSGIISTLPNGHPANVAFNSYIRSVSGMQENFSNQYLRGLAIVDELSDNLEHNPRFNQTRDYVRGIRNNFIQYLRHLPSRINANIVYRYYNLKFRIIRVMKIRRLLRTSLESFNMISSYLHMRDTLLVSTLANNRCMFERKILSWADHTITLLAQLYNASGLVSIGLSIKSYVDAIGLPHNLIEKGISIISEAIHRMTPTASITALLSGDGMNDFKFSDYPIIMDVLVAAATVTALPIIAEHGLTAGWKDIRSSVKSTIKNGPFMVVALGALLRSLKFSKDLIMGSSSPPIPSEVEEWCNESISLLHRLVSINSYIEGKSQPAGLLNQDVARINKLLQSSDLFLTSKCLDEDVSPILRGQILTLQKRLIDLKSKLRKYLNASNIREQPAVVYFVGPPGCSKSMWTNFAIKAHARLFGLSDDPLFVEHIMSDDKFLSTHDSGKVYAIINDMQMFKASTTGIDPQIMNLAHMIDNAPMLPNMAAIPDKAQMQINFQCMILNSNEPCAGLLDHVQSPFAFKRRFKYTWEVHIRPKYTDEIGNATAEASDNINEAYYFRRFVPCRDINSGRAEGKWAGYKTELSPSGHVHWTPVEFAQDMNRYFKAHAANQKNYVETISKPQVTCPKCQVATVICGHAVDEAESTIVEPVSQNLDVDISLLTNFARDKILRQEIKDSIKQYSNDIYDKTIPYAIPIGAAIIGSAIVSTMIPERGVVEEKPLKTVFTPTSIYNVSEPVMPLIASSQTKKQLIQLIDNNTKKMITRNTETQCTNNAIYLGSCWYLGPKHAFDGKDLVSVRNDSSRDYMPQFRPSTIYDVGSDLALFRYMGDKPSSNGLLKFLYDGELPSGIHTFRKNFQGSKTSCNVKASRVNVSYPSISGDADINVVNGLLIDTFGERSTCGSSLILNMNNRGYMIGGISIAGNKVDNQTIISVPDIHAIKDIIDKHPVKSNIIPTSSLSTIPWTSFNHTEFPFNHKRASVSYVEGNSNPLYFAGKKYMDSTRPSKCRKTELADKLPFLDADQFVIPTMNVQKVDGVYQNESSPMYRSAMHNSKPKNFLPSDEIQIRVFEEMVSMYVNAFKDHEVEPYREFSRIEAINGCSGMERIHMNTSFGYPFRGPKHLQFDIVGEKDDGSPIYDFKPAVLHDFEIYMKACREGKCLPIPFISNFKDEVVSPKKDIAGDVRSYCASSCFTLIRDRMIYGWFVVAYKRCCLSVNSAWGISSEDEWSLMYHKLCQNLEGCDYVVDTIEDYMIAGDFSKFDKSASGEQNNFGHNVIHKVMYVFDYYDSVDSIICDAITSEEAYSVIMTRGDVSEFDGITASGKLLTTLLNGVGNEAYNRFAFEELKSMYSPHQDILFDEVITPFYYGDDNITTSKVPWFNQATLQVYFKKICMKYTDAKKNDNVNPYEEKGEVVFLGRRFALYNDTVLSPLRGSAWIKQLCWLSPATATTEIDRLYSVWPVLLYEISKIILGDLEPDDDQSSVIDNIHRIKATIDDVYGPNSLCDVPSDWDDYYATTRQMYDDEGIIAINPDNFFPTSAQADIEEDAGTVDKAPLITYVDQDAGEEDRALPLSRVFPKLDPQVGLDHILNRKVLVDHFTWTHNSAIGKIYMIMQHLLQDPVIASVCRNYSLITYDSIGIKIVSNGNAFTQALLAMGFLPMRPEWAGQQKSTGAPQHGKYADWINTATPVTSPQPTFTDQTDLMITTHAPGPFPGINVGQSETCYYEIPFVGPLLYSKIATTQLGSVEEGGDPRDQVNFMRLTSYDVLRTSNMQVSHSDIAIYAWFNGAKLRAPKFVPTSVEEQIDQERKESGTVTKTLNKVKAISHGLSDFPIIGSVAGTVSKVAGVASKISNLFGWSSPEDLSPPNRIIQTVAGNIAQTDVMSEALSLTVTQGAELSMNPNKLGMGDVDQMSIKFISNQWSLIAFAGVAPDLSIGTAIFGCVVSPVHTIYSHITSPESVQPTNETFAVWPYGQWRGTKMYAIVPVFAINQRLRLSISFSPDSDVHDTGPSNQQYNLVVDAIAGMVIIVEVAWLSADRFLKVRHVDAATGKQEINVNTVAFDGEFDNGTLEVNILNQLVSPDPTSSAKIFLFTRGGEDFEVANPLNNHFNDWFPTSNETTIDGSNFFPTSLINPKHPDMLEPNTHEVLTLGPEIDQDLYKEGPGMWYGERITSFREMIKRYQYYGTMSTFIGGTDTTKFNTKNIGWYPGPHKSETFQNSTDVTGYISDTTGFLDVSRWMNNGTLFSYLRPAYQGWHGGIRHIANFTNTPAESGGARVIRGTQPFFQSSFPHLETVDLVLNNQGGVIETNHIPQPSNFGGQQINNPNVGFLNYCIPYYSHTLYSATSGMYYFPSDSSGQYDLQDGLREHGHSIAAYSTSFKTWDHYVAAADDFNLMYYTGPPLWYEDQADIT